MGFRSLLITEDTDLVVPTWFLEKHPSLIALGFADEKVRLPIVSKWETKFYDEFKNDERFIDLQKVLIENGENDREITVILLHECDGISKVVISTTEIRGMEPYAWRSVDHVEHEYCYGCSEPTD